MITIDNPQNVCEGATTSTTMMCLIKAGDSLTAVQWSASSLLYEQRDCEVGAFNTITLLLHPSLGIVLEIMVLLVAG